MRRATREHGNGDGVITGLGVGLPWQNGQYARALGALRPAWWYNWLYDQYDYIWPAYAPMVWAMKMDAASASAERRSHQGPRLWLLGNEPERPDQSNTPPAQAADFSRWWADAASGTFACAGVLLGLPPAYAWLDVYLAAGGMVGAYWHVHNYGWTPDQWDGNLTPFLSWMRANRVERPVIVSECASWDQGLPAQMAIMDRVQVALAAGNIVAACWYSSRDPFGAFRGADLLTETGELTELGVHYREMREGNHGGLPVPEPAGEHEVHLPVVMG